MSSDGTADYPLGTERPDVVRTPGGRPLQELTLDALRRDELSGVDMRVTAQTLKRQAEIARAVGRTQLAMNLSRAAELTSVPDDVVLDIYTALRPHRSTAEDLEHCAERLEREFSAPLAAAFVREAKAVYAEYGLLSVGEQVRSPAV